MTFLLVMVKYQPYLICYNWFYPDYHIAKAPNITEHIFKIWSPNRKLILYYGKVKEPIFPSVKKAKILYFLGT